MKKGQSAKSRKVGRASPRAASKDRLTQERRSWNMSRIRGKDTKPEMLVRGLLHKMGYRFRLHVRIPVSTVGTSSTSSHFEKKKISGTRWNVSLPRFVRPDIVLPKYKPPSSFTVVFGNGTKAVRIAQPQPIVRISGWRNSMAPEEDSERFGKEDWWLPMREF